MTLEKPMVFIVRGGRWFLGTAIFLFLLFLLTFGQNSGNFVFLGMSGLFWLLSLAFSESVSVTEKSIMIKQVGINKEVDFSQISELKFNDVSQGFGLLNRHLVIKLSNQGLQPLPTHLEPIFIRFGLFHQKKLLLQSIALAVKNANPNVAIDSQILAMI